MCNTLCTKATKTDLADIIRENYPKFGPKRCAELTGLTLRQIKSFCGKRKITMLPEVRSAFLKERDVRPRHSHLTGVDVDVFNNPNTKERAYLLGFMWADGHVRKEGYSSSATIEIAKEDADCLSETFLKTGNWATYHRPPSFKRGVHRKARTTFQSSNRFSVDFLLSMGYGANDRGDASKILALVPEELKRYWFLGLIDGDGCFYFNERASLKQFSIASSYDHNWGHVSLLFQALGVTSRVVRREQKRKDSGVNRSSVIRSTGDLNLRKIISYLYPNGYELGLKRKFDKAMQIVNCKPKRPYFSKKVLDFAPRRDRLPA